MRLGDRRSNDGRTGGAADAASAASKGARARRERGRPAREPWWSELPGDELLDVRLCDLGLAFERSPIAPRLAQLHDELERAGLSFRPYAWLSTSWFTPDGLTGFAVPFYLAHRRLVELERRAVGRAEGSSGDECMKLLRHETAHALDNAYGLHRRKSWRAVFGRFTEPYRATYLARPHSRRYVHNLDHWYAQSHPAEDFAETFAVWLRPGSRWRTQYAGWPALAKLEYVDELLRDLDEETPKRTTRARSEPLAQCRTTLRDHYARRRCDGTPFAPTVYDADLERLFTNGGPRAGTEPAASYLTRRGGELRERVSTWTRESPYVVDQILKEMILRCRELGLRAENGGRDPYLDVLSMVSVHAAKLRHRGPREYRR